MLATPVALHGQAGCIPEYEFLGESAGNQLGATVANLGDVDGDGINDYIVGAPSPTGIGKVYLYSGADGSLIRSFSGESSGDLFGSALCSAGDTDLDGVNDILIGAYGFNDETGGVYLFSGASGDTLHVFGGSHAGIRFGFSVGCAGDLNNDDRSDLMIGAPRVDSGVTARGAVFIYSGSDYTQIDSLIGSTDFEFGHRVTGIDDINDDSYPELAVAQTTYYASKGRVCIYSGLDRTLLAEFVGERVGDQFGYSLAVMADVSDDGFRDLIVGAPYYDG